MTQPNRALSEAERRDWLRLIRTDHVGPMTFRALLARFGTAARALAALPDLSRQGGRGRPLSPWPAEAAEREMAALARLGGRFVALGEPDYPAALAALEDAPPLLALHGHGGLLGRRAVALVGARNASANGRRFAERLARDLGAAGLVVVSGLARGIDTAAHLGALEAGTVAVVAGGVDVAYPPENADLQRRIAETGAVVAESALGTQPQARHFPRRNRLISGLALGVVVVEAAPRSGSLITARLAAEQGREVMAVPGSPLDPRAQGCNGLIRGGATLVQSAEEVLEALAGLAGPTGTAEPQGDLFAAAPADPPGEDLLAAARATVLQALSPVATPVDELLRDCQLSAPVLFTILLELELAGRLERQPGNRVALIV